MHPNTPGIAALLRLSSDGDAPAKPQPEAAAATLRERYAALMQRHDLAPGDLVAMKPGWECRTEPSAGLPMLLVELDPNAGTDASRAFEATEMAHRCDALCITLGRDGDAVLRRFDSRTLMPWTAPEARTDG